MTQFYLLLCSGFILCYLSGFSQIVDPEWQPQNAELNVSIRGISAVNNDVVWIGGQNGRFAMTRDGGNAWKSGQVPNADSLDFRDIEAFSENIAFLMSAGPGGQSRIYKTEDGGETWDIQYKNTFEHGFFDGFAFWDDQNAILIGDPIDHKLFLLKTEDGGRNWERIAPEKLPELMEGEYGFAASGTGITVYGDHVWIGTGGTSARVFHSGDRGATWEVFETPIIKGKSSTGIFSIDFRDAKHGILVGGDYTQPNQPGNNIAISNDGGKTWSVPTETLTYRSCVQYASHGHTAISVGRGGTSSYTNNDGHTWKSFGSTGLYTLSFAKDGKQVWAAGPDGKVVKLSSH